ncbi:hypothetical protein NT6N_02860 [Oceaniferula spumae]|uniref:CHAT domain-containing protein n=1 Tax=Oceaniferula spumae TaxID=2979115 RepID=A0AAT9FGX2_9BACT
MNFTETNQVYTAMESVLGEDGTEDSGLNTISVTSDHVRQFHAALGAFRRQLVESEVADEWAAFLRSIKRWFHLYLTTPVEGQSLLPWCPRIDGLGRLKQSSQPYTRQLFDDLNTKFQSLLQIEQHPFLDQILDALPEGIDPDNEQTSLYRLGVVVEGRRVCQHVSKWFDTFDIGVPVHVVTPSDLKKENHFDQLILMGSPRWFTLAGSMHVLNSPRANQLTFMGFEPFFTAPTADNFYFFNGSPHLFTGATTQGLLKAPACRSYTICTNDEDEESNKEDTEPISASEIDDIIPTIDSSKVFSSFEQSDPNDDEVEVTASCHFGRLSANAGVFLNTEASIYRILLRQSSGAKLICNEIEKTPVTALSPGDIVMFSTHGAGDMTASIANSLLGDLAPVLREKQSAWKMKVQSRFYLFGTHHELRKSGVLSASETNFNNWLRPHTIMPKNKTEFLKLLLLTGYSEDEAADTITAMRRISAAHQSAGRKVAQMLRKSAKGTHLNQLEKNGMQVLHGELGTSAEMRAYYIEQIDHREYELPISKLNHPFELTDDLWLA